MKIVEIAEANATLAEYTTGLAEEPVIITNNGQPIAALVTLENVDLETVAYRGLAKEYIPSLHYVDKPVF